MNWEVVVTALNSKGKKLSTQGYVEEAIILWSLADALDEGLTSQPEGPSPQQLHAQSQERHPVMPSSLENWCC